MKTIALIFWTVSIAAIQKVHSQPLFDSTLTWQAVKAKARKTNKKIFVDCYTDWCLPCKQMDKEVFSRSGVAETLNKGFVSVKANMEKGWGVNLALRFGIRSYPTYLVLDPSGKLLFKLIGRMDSTTFLQKLNSQLEDSSLWFKGYTALASLNMPPFYTQDFTQKGYRVQDTTLSVYLSSQDGQLEKETNWLVLKAFAGILPPKYSSYVVSHWDTLSRLYGKEDVAAIALGNLEPKLRTALQKNNETAFDSTLKVISAIRQRLGHNNYAKLQANAWIEFYGRNNRWDEYWQQIETYRQHFGQANDIFFCRQMASSCREESVLIRAHELLGQVLKVDSSFYPVFTNYMLLTKMNRTKEAAPQLIRAVALAHNDPDPAIKDYLLNNTYLLLVKSKSDESAVRFIESEVIARAFPEKASFLSALLFIQFYKQFKQYEPLLDHLEVHWAVLKEDQQLHQGLKGLINKLQKVFEKSPKHLQRLRNLQ